MAKANNPNLVGDTIQRGEMSADDARQGLLTSGVKNRILEIEDAIWSSVNQGHEQVVIIGPIPRLVLDHFKNKNFGVQTGAGGTTISWSE